MTRGIGDNEFSFVGGEEAIGHIDGDALFTLGLKSIKEKGVVDLAILGADPLAFGGQRGELIFKQQLRIPQKAADKGAFAVIDAAASDKTEEILLFLCLEIGVDFRCYAVRLLIHQK